MSHALEINANGQANMMYVGQTPWHGLGQVVDESLQFDMSHCLEASGLDTEVGLAEMQTIVPTNVVTDDGKPVVNVVSVPERYTYRKSDGTLFGCVGPRYVPLQNKEAFEFFQPWLDTKQVGLHTAGALFGGKKVWVLAKILADNLEIRKNDPIESFVLLSNSHDGTTAVRVALTPVRVVCWNTLSMAIRDESAKFIRIRHTGQVKDNLEKVREIIDLVKQEFVATAEQYRALASRDIYGADLVRYVKILFDCDKQDDDSIATRKKNLMEKVFERFEHEKAIAGATWWNAYNAYNYYLCHLYGADEGRRLDSLWFGTNAKGDAAALDLAMKMSNLIAKNTD